ncbi:MAG: hypothetical protein ACXW3C_02870 [Pyrinomonadaceae bacterium]
MSTQELLAEIQKLPREERHQLLDALTGDVGTGAQTDQPMSEDEVERILFARGIIGEIPDPSAYTDEDEDFEPIEVLGPPLSETIIEERR